MSARKFLDSITTSPNAPLGRITALSFDFLAMDDLPFTGTPAAGKYPDGTGAWTDLPTVPPPPPPPVITDLLPLYPPAAVPAVYDLGVYLPADGGAHAGFLYWKPCGTCDTPTYTLDGPLTGEVGVESDPYTIQPGYDATGIVFTPATSIGGTFTPASVTGSGYDALTFTFTPSATGTHSLSTANDRGLPDPAALSVVVSAAPGSSCAAAIAATAGNGSYTYTTGFTCSSGSVMWFKWTNTTGGTKTLDAVSDQSFFTPTIWTDCSTDTGLASASVANGAAVFIKCSGIASGSDDLGLQYS